ncbi:hypothetical protein NQZ79_g6348 [Umbelopsis isabellina]|nr:hypothetical protein NQZ79_g6348 [Umbelopsis isabellina]
MIAIPPYVPSSMEGISEGEWKAAHQIWVGSLKELLEADNIEAAIIDMVDLGPFLDTFTAAQLSPSATTQDYDIMKLVFILYARTSDSLSPDSKLIHADMFAPDLLMSFATLYNKSNQKMVRNCFRKIISNIPDLMDRFTQSIEPIGRLYMSVASAALDHTQLNQILALSSGLDSLLASSVEIARSFEASNDLLPSIIALYEGSLSQAAVKAAGSKAKETVLLIRTIKLTIISIFNHLIDGCFFSYYGYTTSLHDFESLEPVDIVPAEQHNVEAVHYLNNKILDLIEQSGLEKTVNSLIDAPLIMDVEIESYLGKRVAKVNKLAFDNEEEQLEFLVLSMEHLRAMSSNDESHQRRKQQFMALKLSNHEQNATQPTVTKGLDEPDMKTVQLISQVLDLFPDLGEGFVEACLQHYGGDIEQVTNNLLEETLPANLAQLDRSMPRMSSEPITDDLPTVMMKDLTLVDNSELQKRRNIFDNDEFDVFAGKKVDQKQVHRGKLNRGDANRMLDDKSFVQSEKANLLQRIADIYEDEIDDTYDDVGMPTGKVDLGSVEDGSEEVVKQRKNEMDPGILYESDLVHTYVNNVKVFERSAASRRSSERAMLKKATGMTDEQLEGWSIMFSRNPRKQKILDKYALYDGPQTELTNSTSESAPQKQGKERPPRTAAQERNYKDKNKSKFANHNRKKMHDKKLGKSMAPVN